MRKYIYIIYLNFIILVYKIANLSLNEIKRILNNIKITYKISHMFIKIFLDYGNKKKEIVIYRIISIVF